MPAVKDTTNQRINMNNSGTEANPYSIESVVTDIADATYIEQIGKVVFLKKPLDWRTGFLRVPDYITLVAVGGSFFNNNNSASVPTNGLELQGACTVVLQSGLAAFGSAVQSGTGIIKCTQRNGVYPTVRQQQGGRHDTFLAAYEVLSNYNNLIYKVDGLNLQLSNEAHIKWYTTNASSYVRYANIQRAASGYAGATPTAFQLHYGATLADARSSEFAVSGDFPESPGVSSLIRPTFDITTARPLKGYLWRGTWLDIIDPKFASGGSWNGLISPDGTGGAGTGIGARLRHKTTYNAAVAKGSTKISGVKFALIPTKTTATAVPSGLTSEAVSTAYLITDAAGEITQSTLLYKEWFPTTTTANQASNTTTNWRITARHPIYIMNFELQAAAGATSLVAESVSAADNPYCTLTKTQAESATAPYTGITPAKATTTISLSSNRTVSELRNYNYWWLYQDAQMDFADPFDGSATPYSLGSWDLSGAEYLTGAIMTTGNITCASAPLSSLDATASVITTTGTNIARLTASTRIDGLPTTGSVSAGGKLGFGTGTTIASTGDLTISGTELSGSLTINTAVARRLTLSNCTGALSEIKVSGTGSLEVRIEGTTPSTIVPTSLPAGVTAGVVVSVSKVGGGVFSIAARYRTTGAYTDLGYQADVSSVTYTVPNGAQVEVIMWSLGCVTYSRTISTSDGGVVLDAEMSVNASINTALDVSSYLSNIALSLDTSGASPVFVITFNAPMTVSGIELGKAIIHRLVGSEVALRSGFPPGSMSTIVINSDEITNQLPVVRLDVGASVTVTGRVYLDFFINQAPALLLNPAYVINPVRSDGNQVQILRSKPALDPSQMAAAVQAVMERTGGMLDTKASQSSVTALGAPAQATALSALATTNQAEHDATQAAVAALPAPANADIAAIKTKVDTLQNTDLTAVNSGIADIKGTGFDATKHNLVAIKRQASLAAALSA